MNSLIPQKRNYPESIRYFIWGAWKIGWHWKERWREMTKYNLLLLTAVKGEQCAACFKFPRPNCKADTLTSTKDFCQRCATIWTANRERFYLESPAQPQGPQPGRLAVSPSLPISPSPPAFRGSTQSTACTPLPQGRVCLPSPCGRAVGCPTFVAPARQKRCPRVPSEFPARLPAMAGSCGAGQAAARRGQPAPGLRSARDGVEGQVRSGAAAAAAGCAQARLPQQTVGGGGAGTACSRLPPIAGAAGTGLQPVAAAGAGPGSRADLAARRPPPGHGYGAVGAEALPQLSAPPQGAAVDRGADRTSSSWAGTAPRHGGWRGGVGPALPGAAAARGRTGRGRRHVPPGGDLPRPALTCGTAAPCRRPVSECPQTVLALSWSVLQYFSFARGYEDPIEDSG